VGRINSAEGEIEFMNEILAIDAKNIHAWGYRQWLIKKFGLWSEESEYTQALIENDPYNNSAWSERYFVFSNTSPDELDMKRKEISLALEYCKLINNESPFNYLRAYYCEEFEEIVKETMAQIVETQDLSRQILQFLAFVYEKENKAEVLQVLYRLLFSVDNRRKNYWAWKERTMNGKNISRTKADIQLCKILNNKKGDALSEYYSAITKLVNI